MSGKARTGGEEPADQPREQRAKLLQKRSRTTRHRIVKAAMQLWTKRGFDEGFDTTTVDEIAAEAEVSRATVYYHFTQKEEILRELAWVTAEEIHEVALRSMMSGEKVDKILDDIMSQLGARVSRTSRAAIRRMLKLRNSGPQEIDRDLAAGGLTRAFSVVIAHAQESGEFPRQQSSVEIAEILSSIAMGCIGKWSIVGDIDLVELLRRRTRLVLAGARALSTTAS